jgi:hypothetical protein
VLALVVALALRGPERQAPLARSRPAEHVAYMELGGWPQGVATRAPAPAGTMPASTPSVSPDADPAGAARPARDANRPVLPVDTAAGAAGPAPAGVPGVEEAALPIADGAGTRTRAARLGAEYGDPRLVPATSPRASSPAPPPADVARYEAQFRAAWRAFGDSIDRGMDRERLAANWTWKDPSGRAWNVRDGALFLDGRRIMAMEMQGNRDQERAARAQSTARREIARQAEDIERDRYIQERSRAIRARRDQERREARP